MQSTVQFNAQSIATFTKPRLRSAVAQLLNTFIPYVAVWILMVITVQQGYPFWITALLMFVGAGFTMRLFIIFHDCCHGSFFESRRANRILGYITGVLTFTPFDQWRRTHSRHHDTVGDLDRRGIGDVWTLTVDEYLARTKFRRFVYRLLRNPLVMLGFGPALLFLIIHRFYGKQDKKREHISVIVTDLAIAAIVLIATFTIGLRAYLIIQLPVFLIAGGFGIAFFYVQHQFEGVYWARNNEWEPMKAAVEGSSYLKLPRVLQWFTGNIGLHHIHHIQQRIPNYNLQQCHDATPAFRTIKPVTLWGSLKCFNLKLWDEKKGMLVSFQSVRFGSSS